MVASVKGKYYFMFLFFRNIFQVPNQILWKKYMSIIIYFSYHLKRLCSKYTKILTTFLYFFSPQIQVNLPKKPKISKLKLISFFKVWAMPMLRLQQNQQLLIQSIVIPVKIKEIGKKCACKKQNQFWLYTITPSNTPETRFSEFFAKLSLFIKSSQDKE